MRQLLAGCCISCRRAQAGECGGTSTPASHAVSDPGSLEPAGPLAADVQRALSEITRVEPTRDNRVRLLVDGTQSYGAMLDLVESARTDIRFENFIFRDDTVGRAFAQALLDRSAVADVRVLYDPFGSVMSRRFPIGRRFRDSRVDVRLHNPFRPTRAFLREGRDHRKLVVQDRRRLVAGGMCLADVWSGNCIRHCTWRDSAVLVEGSAARAAAREFDRVWLRGVRRTGPREGSGPGDASVDSSAVRNELASASKAGGVPVRILAGCPGERRLERVLTRVFDAAGEEILITNPYFLPSGGLMSSLRAAAGRGVRVEILLPARNNHRLAGLASEHLLGSLLEAGVRVWYWLGPMIHAKTVVVDRRWSVVGSSNLDPLSLRRNLELDVEIHGSTIGEELGAIFTRDTTGSRPFTADDHGRRPLPSRGASRLAFALRNVL